MAGLAPLYLRLLLLCPGGILPLLSCWPSSSTSYPALPPNQEKSPCCFTPLFSAECPGINFCLAPMWHRVRETCRTEEYPNPKTSQTTDSGSTPKHRSVLCGPCTGPGLLFLSGDSRGAESNSGCCASHSRAGEAWLMSPLCSASSPDFYPESLLLVYKLAPHLSFAV